MTIAPAKPTYWLGRCAPFGKVQCGINTPHCTGFFTLRADVDAAIEAAARQQFSKSSYPGLRGVRCNAKQGVLKLTGSVGSFYLKQVAIGTARRLKGVHAVLDEIVVDGAANFLVRSVQATNGL